MSQLKHNLNIHMYKLNTSTLWLHGVWTCTASTSKQSASGGSSANTNLQWRHHTYLSPGTTLKSWSYACERHFSGPCRILTCLSSWIRHSALRKAFQCPAPCSACLGLRSRCSIHSGSMALSRLDSLGRKTCCAPAMLWRPKYGSSWRPSSLMLTGRD